MMENGIKRIRLCLGLTQQQFADMLGCTQGNIGHYETRDQMVPPETARKLIAEAAKRGSVVSYEDIYGAVDEPVVIARFVVTRKTRETNERKNRHAED
jgi:putative transcriptional regulator